MEIFLYVCVCGWQLSTAALLINKQVLFDFITLSRAFLGSCAFTMNIYASKWECGTQVARGRQPSSRESNNSCRQTHQLPKIAIAWSYWGCRWGSRGGGRRKGEGRQHPQSGCCVASNFINTFIILCHTASGTSGACTPPPSSLSPLPTPPSLPPRPVQTAISLPQRALWLVIWRLISGLT